MLKMIRRLFWLEALDLCSCQCVLNICFVVDELIVREGMYDFGNASNISKAKDLSNIK